jgi:drug/metabolite transporter (DMT)-like permease
MNSQHRAAFGALVAAGVLWGTTVPLSKVALDFLPPGWLAFARFAIAGVLLAVVVGPRLRAVLRPDIVVWGAVGYGGSILVQNIGVAHTNVSHAALIVGLTPILVAGMAAAWSRTGLPRLVWIGAGLSVLGVAFVAGAGGAGASIFGDLVVLASLLFACAFTVAQGYLLPGRDPIAVSAVQFLAAAAALAPMAVLMEGAPSTAAGDSSGLAAVLALAVVGTLLPFGLFAYAQGFVAAPVAGAFINIEPIVGVAIAAIWMGESLAWAQVVGALAIVTGLALTSRAELAVPKAVPAEPAADGVVDDDGLPAGGVHQPCG